MTQEPTIDAKGLHLTFETNDGPVHALQDVNFEINKGDFVSFIGPSGCEVSTSRLIVTSETPKLAAKSEIFLAPERETSSKIRAFR